MDKFTGCKYQEGQHVIPRHVLREGGGTPTVWQIIDVTPMHGGKNYYHCSAPGFGIISLYEDDIHVTSEPVSRFP